MAYLLQHLLMNAAQRFPDNTAVAYGDQSISYRDLDKVTDKLSATLHESGVKRGDRVGIYMHKSISSIISIHGVLKAGAVYVPLDPTAPPARLAYIVQNCGIRHLLTSTQKAKSLATMFPDENPLELVVVMDSSASPPAEWATRQSSWVLA